METLNEVCTEKQVDEVSNKILKSTIEKIKSELSDKFYNEINSFIYEHYINASDEIHEKLIKEITDEFISDPKNYKFLKLRQKLFNENKELLTKIITDEAIEKSVENVIWQHTDKSYHFNWKWADAIVRIIGENWHKLKDDERVNDGLLHQIEQLKSQISHLQEKLNDVQNVVSEQD
jgi:putative ubiquitin-RnfH superfamily antitoxin RatB of RatAB toxin-antitoxin module